MRSSADILKHLEDANHRLELAQLNVDKLNRELAVARVAEQKHDWLGKVLKREVSVAGLRHSTRTVKGRLMIFGAPGTRSHYTGLYRPEAGDLIVVAREGLGSLAYAFYQPHPHLIPGETEWEVVA